jgi:osmotically-inducible protein OsmY
MIGMSARGAFDDQEILSKVLVELGVAGVNRDNLDAEFQDGVVTLSGSVESDEMREEAGKAAMRQFGVKKVENNLVVESA